jgi:hypothetical protein
MAARWWWDCSRKDCGRPPVRRMVSVDALGRRDAAKVRLPAMITRNLAPASTVAVHWVHGLCVIGKTVLSESRPTLTLPTITCRGRSRAPPPDTAPMMLDRTRLTLRDAINGNSRGFQ